MSRGWAGPSWGEPSIASESPVPLRAVASSADAGYRADGGRSTDFAVMAASVAGVAHRLARRRCEDAYGWAQPRPGQLGLVIADGVSTAGRGGEGADIVIGAACRYLLSPDASDWGKRECEAAVRAANEDLVRAAGPAAREFSTTFVVALLSTTDDEPEAVLARVGDSTAFTLEGSQWRELFRDPDDEEFRDVPVEVLPLREDAGPAAIELSSVTLAPSSALVLLTDGVADPLREGPATVAPALAGVLSGGPSGDLAPLDLARASDFSRRGCQDDRTILAAWPARAARADARK
jgi:Protein phosphatase 2C